MTMQGLQQRGGRDWNRPYRSSPFINRDSFKPPLRCQWSDGDSVHVVRLVQIAFKRHSVRRLTVFNDLSFDIGQRYTFSRATATRSDAAASRG